MGNTQAVPSPALSLRHCIITYGPAGSGKGYVRDVYHDPLSRGHPVDVRYVIQQIQSTGLSDELLRHILAHSLRDCAERVLVTAAPAATVSSQDGGSG